MLSRAVLSVLFLVAAVGAQQVSDRADAVLARAGEHRAEYEQAWQQVAGAERQSYEFLLRHMPKADFGKVSPALLLENVRLSHTVRNKVAWGKALSDELFHNDVVPYAQANETRESWRPSMVEQFLPLVADCKTPGEAAQKLNESIFKLLNTHYSTKRRRADQSPSESIAEGKASCTGLSILLADACRACCVPARLISVQWPHKPGNHTWVEVWDGQAWRFVGADEPDPKGLDRGWFVGDAQQCSGADAQHRIWAVSFAATGARFAAGWGPKLSGVDVTSRYAGTASESPEVVQARADEVVRAQIDRYFAADEVTQTTFSFDRNLDEELKTKPGDARLRQLVWQALRAHSAVLLAEDHAANRVRAGGKESPFTVKQVGTKPEGGWPLVIAMHGGGGVPKEVNDSQWQHMQVYYQDHPETDGYLYCALRAPTDEWNGFYTDYFYPVIEQLIRQLVVCSDVNPDRVLAIGYSHGGYGAFAVGPKLPHRFAAVHASAAAPSDGQSVPDGLHSLAFSFMVGGKDTAYGRRERCEKFAAQLVQLQQAFPGQYPSTFTLVADCGHGGLPDRDLLQQLLPSVRQVMPSKLHWRLTDATVKDHYWLHVAQPSPGMVLSATKTSDSELLVAATAPFELWLDARGLDLQQQLRVRVQPSSATDQAVVTGGAYQPAPSLRTLCQTMQRRNDPQLAATWVLPIQ